jgi:hypothetical protein
MNAQGANISNSGRRPEKDLEYYLGVLKYSIVSGMDARSATAWFASGRDISDWFIRQADHSNGVYIMRHALAENIYGIPWKVDCVLWHPVYWTKCLYIEVKTQGFGGSVDEKFPFMVASLLALRKTCCVLLLGDGARPGAIQWLKSHQSEDFHVFRQMHDLRIFIESGGKRVIIKPANRVEDRSQMNLFRAT